MKRTKSLKRGLSILLIVILLFATSCDVEDKKGDLDSEIGSGKSSSNTATNNKKTGDTQQGEGNTEKRKVKAVNDIEDDLVNSNNEFAFHLYDELISSEGDNNVFICPTSISLALSMTYNGADGETKAAMADALKFKGMSLEKLNEENLKLKSILENADKDVTLEIANSIWARKGIEFKTDFMERNKDYYGAHVETLDFTASKAPKTINGWVKEATHEKIEGIVGDNIDPATVMFLINAIYFNGDWTRPFDAKNTTKDIFTNYDSSKSDVDMMYQTDRFRYFEDGKFQAIALPYGEERLSMYIFLPDESSTLPDFLENLTLDNWSRWMDHFEFKEGNIGLPRIELEYEQSLNEVLKAMGMGVAFDRGKADFGLMYERDKSSENIFIGNVQHKTYLAIDEEGTEAAGVTSVEMKIESAPIEEDKFDMIVNRPFFFTIQDDDTGVILFMGSITEM